MQKESASLMKSTPLRSWLLVVALLFSQWVLADHDHAAVEAHEVCQVCVVTDHFDLVGSADVNPHIPVITNLPIIEQRSASITRSSLLPAVRAPPFPFTAS